MVMSQIYQEGNYTCEAANEFGTDSRDFQITFIGNNHSFVQFKLKSIHLHIAPYIKRVIVLFYGVLVFN